MSTSPPAPPAETPMRLPDIPLDELEGDTKDFILAYSAATGLPVDEVVKTVLRNAAHDSGFPRGQAA